MKPIFESMRDSPDEITRKRFEILQKMDKDAAWMIRHALGSNHGYKPESCSGCSEVEKFLVERPE